MSEQRPLPPIRKAWLNALGADLRWLEARAPAVPPAAPPAAGRKSSVKKTPPTPASPKPPSVSPSPPPSAVRPAPAVVPAPPAPAPASTPASASAEDAPHLEAPAALHLPDLDALAQAVQDCQRCPRHAQRMRAVPGQGASSRPRYLIVGEQPGIEDDTCGQAFQGDAGRLLQAMLAAVQLPDRESVWYTTVVKCRAAGGREPTPAEIAACIPFLSAQIDQLRPAWILALGQVAARAVLASEAPLDALRGGPHVCRLGSPGGTPPQVWVTHQPASLLVRGAFKPQAWRDLLAWVQSVQGRTVTGLADHV